MTRHYGWTKEEIAAAIYVFHYEQQRPPRYNDWRHASPANPSSDTVARLFGSFGNAIRECGMEVGKPGRPRKEAA